MTACACVCVCVSFLRFLASRPPRAATVSSSFRSVSFRPVAARMHALRTHVTHIYVCTYVCVCCMYSRSRLAAAAHSRVSLSARTLRSRHRERIAGSFWIELEKQGGTRNAPRHRRSRTRRSYILGFLETLLILLPRVDFAFLSKLCHIVASMSL